MHYLICMFCVVCDGDRCIKALIGSLTCPLSSNHSIYKHRSSPLLMYVTYRTSDLTQPDMTGYIFDSTAGACPQRVKITLSEHLFTYLGFPECVCCLECNVYSRLCRDYGIMVFDYRMTDGYFLPYTSKWRVHFWDMRRVQDTERHLALVQFIVHTKSPRI